MDERDAVWLGATAIHSVTNPLDRLTGALHVYGGDFFGTARSEWDEETLEEAPYDVVKLRRLFDESNRRLDGMRTTCAPPPAAAGARPGGPREKQPERKSGGWGR